MPFKTGHIANPTGINRRKPWADAIRIVMSEDDPKTHRPRLLLLAERLFAQAMAGDMAAIKEIGDRLDGKPAQGVVGYPSEPGEPIIRWLTAAEVKALPKPGNDGLD
jgi:hypothetical protein